MSAPLAAGTAELHWVQVGLLHPHRPVAIGVARATAARHYFGHTDPNGVTFEDRLRSAEYQYRYATENMALDQDELHANAAFLHSPSHYANIVDRHPHKLGVAAGDGEVFFVEDFSD